MLLLTDDIGMSQQFHSLSSLWMNLLYQFVKCNIM